MNLHDQRPMLKDMFLISGVGLEMPRWMEDVFGFCGMVDIFIGLPTSRSGALCGVSLTLGEGEKTGAPVD
jgi:hypothetical protein